MRAATRLSIHNPFPSHLLLSLLGASVLLPSLSNAGVIDFENIPGVGTPTEGLVIHSQFAATETRVFVEDYAI